MTVPLVTVLVPHYKTLELTKLCLRLLRKHTPAGLFHCIVIDNNSQDASSAYLRTVSWIELIERKPLEGERPLQGHPRALDLAMTRVKTPYVLSFHTDTLVKRSDWLSFLLHKIEKNKNMAGVGSWKLESRPWHKRWLKKIERCGQLFYYGLINKKNHAIEGKGDNYFYLRSHCALYRTDLIRKYHLKFDEDDTDAGKILYKKLIDKNYQALFLPSEELGQYIDHIDHATMVLNPELGAANRTIQKGLRRIQARLKQVGMDIILKDESLDR